jgi:hypothetical protein
VPPLHGRLGQYLGDGHITAGRRNVHRTSGRTHSSGRDKKSPKSTLSEPFLRGLFHSDGCRMTNWTQRRVTGELKRYEYPGHFFTRRWTAWASPTVSGGTRCRSRARRRSWRSTSGSAEA